MLDPQHRSVGDNLQHIIIFCRVHFLRGIRNTIGNDVGSNELFGRMASLLDCQSKTDYFELAKLIASK